MTTVSWLITLSCWHLVTEYCNYIFCLQLLIKSIQNDVKWLYWFIISSYWHYSIEHKSFTPKKLVFREKGIFFVHWLIMKDIGILTQEQQNYIYSFHSGAKMKKKWIKTNLNKNAKPFSYVLFFFWANITWGLLPYFKHRSTTFCMCKYSTLLFLSYLEV